MIVEENGKRKMDGKGKFLGNFSENEVHATTGNGNNMNPHTVSRCAPQLGKIAKTLAKDYI